MKKLLLLFTTSIISSNASLLLISCGDKRVKHPGTNSTDDEKNEDKNKVFDLSKLTIKNLRFDVSYSEDLITDIIFQEIKQQNENLDKADLIFNFLTPINGLGDYDLVIESSSKNPKITGKNTFKIKVINAIDLSKLHLVDKTFEVGITEREVIDIIMKEIKHQNSSLNEKDFKFFFSKNINNEGNLLIDIWSSGKNPNIIGLLTVNIKIVKTIDLSKLNIGTLTFGVSNSKEEITGQVLEKIKYKLNIAKSFLDVKDFPADWSKPTTFFLEVVSKNNKNIINSMKVSIKIIEKIDLVKEKAKLNLTDLKFASSVIEDTIVYQIANQIKTALGFNQDDYYIEFDIKFSPNYDLNKMGKYELTIKSKNDKIIVGEIKIEIIVGVVDLSTLKIGTKPIEITPDKTKVEAIIKKIIKDISKEIDTKELKIVFANSFDPNKIGKNIAKISAIANALTVENSLDFNFYMTSDLNDKTQFSRPNTSVSSQLTLKNKKKLVVEEDFKIYLCDENGNKIDKDPLIKQGNAGPVRAMIELQDNTILIATDSGKVLHYDFVNPNPEIFEFGKKLKDIIGSFFKFEDGTILLLGVNKKTTKIYLFDMKKPADLPKEIASIPNVSFILQLPDKTFLGFTTDHSVYDFN